MSLLMDALKKADEAVDTSSSTNPTIDLDNELLPQFQIDSQLDITSEQLEDSASGKWDEDFLPQFKEGHDEIKDNNLDTCQDSQDIAINNGIETSELSDLIEPPAQIKLPDKINDDVQNLFSLTDREYKNSDNVENLTVVGITEQSPLEDNIPEFPKYEPQDAQRIFTATNSPKSSKYKAWLLSILGVLAISIGTGYYYLQSSFNQSSGIKFGNLPKRTEGDLPKRIEGDLSKRIEGNLPKQAEDNLPKRAEFKPILVKHTEPVAKIIVDNKPSSTSLPKIKPIEKITQATTNKIKTVKPVNTISEVKTVPVQPVKDITLQKKKVNPVNKDLSKGYAALQNGNNEVAKRAYQQVLQQDKNNRDALLGLAALAIRNHNIPQAQKYYQQILHNYPNDIHAQIGLINTNDSKNESQLKLLLRQAPKAAYIHFSLGNLYANQGRWSLAQQAYFDAMRYDNNHADYVYNLAISLDQINQPKVALTYYRKTLNLVKNQPISFDPKMVQKRIITLTKALK